MENLEQKVNRLKNVLEQIEAGERFESNFDKLYEILQDEYFLEGGVKGVYVMNNYRHSLEQTIEKQAEDFIYHKRKRPKKGAHSYYASFIRHFKNDVTDELYSCENSLGSPSGEKEV